MNDYGRILAIDDCRELCRANVLCRTYEDGLKAIKHLGPWDQLLLDHDLGMLESQYSETGRELTGMDILNFLEQNIELVPTEIQIITGNPAARPKMEKLALKLTKMKEALDFQKKNKEEK